jgi:hypothetical protein
MKLLKKLQLIWTFYKGFVLVSTLITACCLYLFWQNGFGIFVVLFWFKIITLGLIYYFINAYKKKEFYYYQNLGISKLLLWTTTLVFDFVLFIILIIQVYKFK